MQDKDSLISKALLLSVVLCAFFMASFFIGSQALAQGDDDRFTVVEEIPAEGNAGFDVSLPEKKKEEIWGTESDVFKALPEDLKEIILDEVQTVYNNCLRKDMYSKLHDCRCVSIYFLDRRLRDGPHTDRNIMLEKVGAVCPNPVETAGYIYQECVPMKKLTFKNVDEYCGCVANEVAVRYGKNPAPLLSYITHLKTEAHVKCVGIAKRR